MRCRDIIELTITVTIAWRRFPLHTITFLSFLPGVSYCTEVKSGVTPNLSKGDAIDALSRLFNATLRFVHAALFDNAKFKELCVAAAT